MSALLAEIRHNPMLWVLHAAAAERVLLPLLVPAVYVAGVAVSAALRGVRPSPFFALFSTRSFHARGWTVSRAET